MTITAHPHVNVEEFFKKAQSVGSSNNLLAEQVIETALKKGVREFCLAAASRNASLVYALANTPEIKTYYWSEERAAAFFALGRAKSTQRPVAVVVTSGSAAAELLPAAMVAHYSGIPLLLITADRPRRYRGVGAPQSAEQVGLFTYYVQYQQDISSGEKCCLDKWKVTSPAHLNVCLEEPSDAEAKSCRVSQPDSAHFQPASFSLSAQTKKDFLEFLTSIQYPLVVIGDLLPAQRNLAVDFLVRLGAPVYAEGFSGIRERKELEHLRISSIDRIWERARNHDYPIDSIIRIGSIPTARLWRDLEDKEGQIAIFSVSELPFSGLSWHESHQANLGEFFMWAKQQSLKEFDFDRWIQADRELQAKLQLLYQQEPLAETSLIHQLSQRLSHGSQVFLGNSLPVREWDSSATWNWRNYHVQAVRGVNGIDGQLATFLGLCEAKQSNWAIVGDLTALYDLVAPWILEQMPAIQANIVIVNNGGGQIFASMYSHQAFLNSHHLRFKPLAEMWGWEYLCWHQIPEKIPESHGGRIIELLPDPDASVRFKQQTRVL